MVLITGASSGIGKAIAEHLAELGHKVYGTSRYPGSYPAPTNFELITLDVTDGDSVSSAVEYVLQKEKCIDILINNAGMGISGDLEHTSIEKDKEQVETLFMGSLRMIKKVLPTMRKQDSGMIINISSIGGLIGLPYQNMYSAAKFAIEGLSESLYKELRSTNIKVVLVEPGDFKTNFTARREVDKTSIKSDKFQRVIEQIEQDENNGQNPIMVAKSVAKIINKPNPRLRYVVGAFDQKLAALLKRILPNRLFDWIIMKHYKVL